MICCMDHKLKSLNFQVSIILSVKWTCIKCRKAEMIQILKHQVLVVSEFVQTSIDNQQKDRIESLELICQLRQVRSHSTQSFTTQEFQQQSLKSRKQDKMLISYILMLFIFWMFLVSQSKATSPKHPWPTNQLQGAMSTHIRLSKHTNIMDQDFGGKNEPLPGDFNEKNVATSAARVEVSIFLSWFFKVLQKRCDTSRAVSLETIAFP